LRIKELYVKRYGPLRDVSLEFNRGIQPIFGDNESGKTLLVDCIIKMLTGKNKDLGSQFNRVDEFPEGYLILEDNGKEIKVEKGNSLADYLSIEADEVRNIFVVREADLKVQDDFYERVTDKLTGLRSQDIKKIIKKLREFGRLTEKENLSDDQFFGKPKSKKNKAEKLKEDVQKYIEEAEKEGVPELEAECIKAEAREKDLEEKIEQLGKARDKEAFLDLKERLGTAEKILKSVNIEFEQRRIDSLEENVKKYEEMESHRMLLERLEKIFRPLNLILPLTIVVAWALSHILLSLLSVIFIFTLIILCYLEWKLSRIDYARKKLADEAKQLGINVENFEEIKEELERRKNKFEDLKRTFTENIGILKRDLKIEFEVRDKDFLESAKKALEKKEAEIDFNVGLKFDKEELDRATEDLKKVKSEINVLNGKLVAHKDKLRTFSDEVQALDFRAFIGRGLEVQIENLNSLKLLVRELDEFIERIERDAELSKTAIEIFSEIEREEEDKIRNLFGPQSLASQLFKEITGGRYDNVSYDSESKTIIVSRPSQETFSVDKLSKGTFDQLYMAIRIDLAQKILGDRKGFFVMDDSFISSGPSRLANATKIIENLSNMGWNIIYFTVRKEDAEILSKLSDNNLIELPPLP